MEPINKTIEPSKFIDSRVELIKVVEVTEDKAYGGSKAYVTLELPLGEGSNRIFDLESFFSMDDVRRIAIREAGKLFNKNAGWSDMSMLTFYKDGEPVTAPVSGQEPADAVRVKYTCLASV